MAPLISPPQRLLKGTSTQKQLSSQTRSYLGNRILPGTTLNGAIYVNNRVPVKMTKKVIVKYISKKLGGGMPDDIFINHEYKFKQEELRIVFKCSIINTK